MLYFPQKERRRLANGHPPQALNYGLVSALVAQAKLSAKQEPGLLDIADFRQTPVDGETTLVELGPYPIGHIPNNSLNEILEFVRGLLAKATD